MRKRKWNQDVVTIASRSFPCACWPFHEFKRNCGLKLAGARPDVRPLARNETPDWNGTLALKVLFLLFQNLFIEWKGCWLCMQEAYLCRTGLIFFYLCQQEDRLTPHNALERPWWNIACKHALFHPGEQIWTHNLLLRLDETHLAEANMEGGWFEASILLLYDNYVDGTGERRSVDFRVKLLEGRWVTG